MDGDFPLPLPSALPVRPRPGAPETTDVHRSLGRGDDGPSETKASTSAAGGVTSPVELGDRG